MRVLVTGGCGFIGSHQVVALLDAGHDVVVLDDLSNSSLDAIDGVAAICGRPPEVIVGDVREPAVVRGALAGCDAVIHFAAKKHVPESTVLAREYHDVNVGGLLALIQAAAELGVYRLVYSSSGSVYGDGLDRPIPETTTPAPTNPYSRTKLMGEWILADLAAAEPQWEITALRYFNPAGAHPSGLIGEDPIGPPSNLLPILLDVAERRAATVTIAGDDFATPDGTGVRDYVHVMDVADAHLAALDRSAPGFRVLNIGRGVPTSVMDLLGAVERTVGRRLARRVGPRRPGDVAFLTADPTLAEEVLGLAAHRSLDRICADGWNRRLVARTDGDHERTEAG